MDMKAGLAIKVKGFICVVIGCHLTTRDITTGMAGHMNLSITKINGPLSMVPGTADSSIEIITHPIGGFKGVIEKGTGMAERAIIKVLEKHTKTAENIGDRDA